MGTELFEILLITMSAGLAMPLGGGLAAIEHIRPRWLETEFRHGVIAFGGGVLLSAVSLVLVPQGIMRISILWVITAMVSGGAAFLAFDVWLERNKTPAAQLVAMLSDFIPEAMALGAAYHTQRKIGFLLAVLIGLQNIPEGFNAYRELVKSKKISGKGILVRFTALALLGPLAGIVGYFFISQHDAALGFIMLFASGGILYLEFQDIAPQAHLCCRWLPPAGAVIGFLFGLVGQILIAGA